MKNCPKCGCELEKYEAEEMPGEMDEDHKSAQIEVLQDLIKQLGGGIAKRLEPKKPVMASMEIITAGKPKES